MQTQSPTRPVVPAAAVASSGGGVVPCGTAGLFETTLDALKAPPAGMGSAKAKEMAANTSSAEEEEPPDDEADDLAWDMAPPLVMNGSLPDSVPLGVPVSGHREVPTEDAGWTVEAAIPASRQADAAHSPFRQERMQGPAQEQKAPHSGPNEAPPERAEKRSLAAAAAPAAIGALEKAEFAIRRQDSRLPAEETLSPAAPAETSRPAEFMPTEAILLRPGPPDAPARITEAAAFRPHRLEPHRQIADAIVRTREGQVEVILNPSELGRVTVILGAEDNPSHLALFVERPETLELIRRHGDQLLRDLRDAGMPDPSLDILQQDGQRHPRHRDGRENWPPQQGRAIGSTPEPAPVAVSLSRLDIRL